jgi:hypothetical protein
MVMLVLGCAQVQLPEPDASEVERALKASVPIAWVGTLTQHALEGQGGDCVVWETPCEDAPCAGVFVIEVGVACPLPMSSAASGDVTVTVDATGLFGAAFGELEDGGRELRIERVEGAVVTRGSDGLIDVGFADEELGMSAEDGEVEVVNSGYAVEVDDGGTVSTEDDAVVIRGARQWVKAGDSAHVFQTALEAEFDGSCRDNPVAGEGLVQEAGAGEDFDTEVATNLVIVEFHEACDGTARAYGGGTSGASLGSELVLDLL